MTITSAGDVGIGTTSPASKLDVNGISTLRDTINIGPNIGVISWGSMGGGTGFGIRAESGRGLSLGSNGLWDYVIINTSGNVGVGTTTPGYKLEVNGSFAATTKSFVIPHPTKTGKKLVHGVVEGPEHSVFVRGKTKSNKIILPEYWINLIDESTITVQLTSIGKHQNLVVIDVNATEITIENQNTFNKDINCYYFVQAERKDIDKLQVEV